MKIENQVLKTGIESQYLGVVLSDELTYTKDVERAKTTFFKEFYSIYYNFYCLDQKVLIHLF